MGHIPGSLRQCAALFPSVFNLVFSDFPIKLPSCFTNLKLYLKTAILLTTGDTGTAKPNVFRIINSHLIGALFFYKRLLSKGLPRVPRG